MGYQPMPARDEFGDLLDGRQIFQERCFKGVARDGHSVWIRLADDQTFRGLNNSC